MAVAYAACYLLLRQVTVSHWNLTTGLRVACMLLVPTRYWPTLIVGEVLPLAYAGWSHHDQFGVVWACAMSVPPTLLGAPFFAWCRRHISVFRAARIDMAAVLLFVLLGAVIAALANCGALALMQLPPGQIAPQVTLPISLNYLLGSFLGGLTVVPVFMALWAWAPRRFADVVAGARSAFLLHLLTGVLPALLVLTWIALNIHNADIVEVARMAMFLPVAWMTLRHGWQGAAAAGTLASIAVQMTETILREPSLIQAQSLIAFAVSSLLMLGARTVSSAVPSVADGARAVDDAWRGFQLAQQGLYQEEQRLRHVAETLERLGQNVRDGQQRMLDRLRPMLPENMDHTYARHLDFTQREMHRLANALHPRSWREHGLAATFVDGPLAQAAAMVGARYRCDLSGAGLAQLAPGVHMMLYRQACEVLVYLLAREPLRAVRLQIRGGCTRGRRWVVLRVVAERSAPAHRGKSVPEWRQVVSLLGTHGQGMATIRERTQIYGGVVHERETAHSLSVALLLHDALNSDAVIAPEVRFARPLSA
ncbi:MASE1 domain-containing protein [Dyella sp. ASV21]|uniref:MASE1 domain-containing protein n=1 Tax=Dyella sp. ASV21 TaxID=2795114 RepID=UPI0018EDD598